MFAAFIDGLIWWSAVKNCIFVISFEIDILAWVCFMFATICVSEWPGPDVNEDISDTPPHYLGMPHINEWISWESLLKFIVVFNPWHCWEWQPPEIALTGGIRLCLLNSRVVSVTTDWFARLQGEDAAALCSLWWVWDYLPIKWGIYVLQMSLFELYWYMTHLDLWFNLFFLQHLMFSSLE